MKKSANKTELVRQALSEGVTSAADIEAYCKAQGVEISAAYVNTIKSNLKKRGAGAGDPSPLFNQPQSNGTPTATARKAEAPASPSDGLGAILDAMATLKQLKATLGDEAFRKVVELL